jgi:hypothetical protein
MAKEDNGAIKGILGVAFIERVRIGSETLQYINKVVGPRVNVKMEGNFIILSKPDAHTIWVPMSNVKQIEWE